MTFRKLLAKPHALHLRCITIKHHTVTVNVYLLVQRNQTIYHRISSILSYSNWQKSDVASFEFYGPLVLLARSPKITHHIFQNAAHSSCRSARSAGLSDTQYHLRSSMHFTEPGCPPPGPPRPGRTRRRSCRIRRSRRTSSGRPRRRSCRSSRRKWSASQSTSSTART